MFREPKLSPAADSLLGFIQTIEHYDLLAADYQPAKLEELQQHCRSRQASAAQADQAELLFSDSFMKLAYHLRYGRMHKHSNILQQLSFYFPAILWYT